MLPPRRVSAVWWMGLGGLMLVVEFFTGLYSQFPMLYIIPVSLAAYYSGRLPGLTLALIMPVAHVAFTLLDNATADLFTVVGLAAFRGVVIAVMALWFARLSEHERALRQEVQTLKGLLPICAFCKSIKNDAGEWERLERFISRRSETEFTHGVCPTCHATHYASGLTAREKQ